MVWLLAGLVAGLLGDLVTWFIGLVYPAVYTGNLISELTSFAAFTALLVFLAGVVAVTIGRWTVDRKAPPYERRREGDERADTDVFAAVQPDRAE
jgi:Kef-type K+ transport system membrane component KefB